MNNCKIIFNNLKANNLENVLNAEQTPDLLVVNELQLEKFAMEYEPSQPIDQSEQADDSRLPAVNANDSDE